MKRFDFNLQRILSLREYREKDWEIRLGEITGRCLRLKNDIDQRIRNRKAALYTWHQEGTTDVSYAGYMEEYIQRMNLEQVRLETELEEAEEQRAEVQRKFLEASRDRKVLDNLKSKRQKEHYKEELSKEFKIMDEMNTSAVVRELRQPAAEDGRA